MDPELVHLRPQSVAESCALTALLDLGELLAAAPIQLEDTRVIGGHMVALHIARHGLGQDYVRMTADTDFGLDVGKLRRLDLVERFAAMNYEKQMGHRFIRALGPQREAVVDVLIPRYTSKPGRARRVGDIESYPTPGLAELLRQPPLVIELSVDFGLQEPRRSSIATADERGALFSKVLAWDDRRRKQDAEKDAFDIWRCLELCHRVPTREWPAEYGNEWKRLLRVNFGTRDGDGCRTLAKRVGPATVTRTVALVNQLVRD